MLMPVNVDAVAFRTAVRWRIVLVRLGRPAMHRQMSARHVFLLIATIAFALVAGAIPATRSPQVGGAGADGPGFLELLRDLFGGGGGDRDPRANPPRNVDLGVAEVPRDEAPLAPVAWPEPKRVGELADRRTANARYFQLSDGRVQAEISSTPTHYKDATGAFQPIDTTVGDVTRPGFVKGNTRNAYASMFGASTDRLVRFEVDGRHVEVGLTGAARAVTPRVEGSTVTYEGVAGGADLVYEVTPRELREKIVLDRAPAGGFSLSFTVAMGGVRGVARDDGSIAFVPLAGGDPAFVIPAPYMYDAGPDPSSPVGQGYSDNVTQTIRQNGSTSTITVAADAGWLADDARTYPVTIDPTIRIQPVPSDAWDVEIYSGNANRNYNDTYQLKVGTDASHAWRTLVQLPLTGVPAGTPIDDAQLQMYYDQTHTTWEHDVALQAHRVTQPWTESTATWANMSANLAAQPTGNTVTVDDGDAGTSVSGTWSYSGNQQLTPLAVNADYRFNNDATTGHTHTWVPTITEAGDYQVEVHFVAESDRATNAPYTVHYNGGSKTYTVDQTGGANGVWKTLGVHPFAAGTTGRVVLGDVSNKAVIADAVRLTKWGAATKKRAVSSVWTTFPVRNVVQDWVNGAQPNYGFMVKAVDEAALGRGGPIYEASEYAYENNRRDYNLPKLVLTFGRQGTTVNPPTTITATGAALTWPAYVDPTGPNGGGDDIVEYQVHRSIYQTYTPSAATLVAPVAKGTLSYQDTAARPTPTDETDPLKRNFFYYMVAVKTADGQVFAGPTQGALLPKAGQITKIFRETSANQVPDTSLSLAQTTTNLDVYSGDPYVSPGNNSPSYGDTRGLVKFGNLSGVASGAQIVDAQLRMWNTSLFPGTDTDEYVDVYRVTQALGRGLRHLDQGQCHHQLDDRRRQLRHPGTLRLQRVHERSGVGKLGRQDRRTDLADHPVGESRPAAAHARRGRLDRPGHAALLRRGRATAASHPAGHLPRADPRVDLLRAGQPGPRRPVHHLHHADQYRQLDPEHLDHDRMGAVLPLGAAGRHRDLQRDQPGRHAAAAGHIAGRDGRHRRPAQDAGTVDPRQPAHGLPAAMGAAQQDLRTVALRDRRHRPAGAAGRRGGTHLGPDRPREVLRLCRPEHRRRVDRHDQLVRGQRRLVVQRVHQPVPRSGDVPAPGLQLGRHLGHRRRLRLVAAGLVADAAGHPARLPPQPEPDNRDPHRRRRHQSSVHLGRGPRPVGASQGCTPAAAAARRLHTPDRAGPGLGGDPARPDPVLLRLRRLPVRRRGQQRQHDDLRSAALPEQAHEVPALPHRPDRPADPDHRLLDEGRHL
jgi:hypothetical protein